MNLDEALAVVLYLQHSERWATKEVLSAAWGVICQEAEKAIAIHSTSPDATELSNGESK